MGKKNKITHGVRKDSISHKMSGVKKGKTKTISTNLKKMNFHNKAKTASADKEFGELHKVVLSGKEKKQKSARSTGAKPMTVDAPPPPDVDSAMDSLESLAMPTTS
ncbi:uncharacterized protein [Haliotis asinina]|uniref:uncharacterized protein n=1 Tax=Haliotis asinina TaxID=109174 RepID=UPI0035325D5A